MYKSEKCSCKACKTIFFHRQICKFVTFLLPSLLWLLKLPNNFYSLKGTQVEGRTTFTFPLTPRSNRRHLITSPPPFRQLLDLLRICLVVRLGLHILKLYNLPSNGLLKLNELRLIWPFPRKSVPLEMIILQFFRNSILFSLNTPSWKNANLLSEFDHRAQR